MIYQAQIVQFYEAHYMQYESSSCIQAAQTSEVEITILDNEFNVRVWTDFEAASKKWEILLKASYHRVCIIYKTLHEEESSSS